MGIFGRILVFNNRRRLSTNSGLHPLTPFASALARSKTMTLVVASSAIGPTPAACERMRFVESRELFDGGIDTLAKEPNPVLTP